MLTGTETTKDQVTMAGEDVDTVCKPFLDDKVGVRLTWQQHLLLRALVPVLADVKLNTSQVAKVLGAYAGWMHEKLRNRLLTLAARGMLLVEEKEVGSGVHRYWTLSPACKLLHDRGLLPPLA